ncbi:MAG: hypothetical protein KBT40_05865, partial [bacterium]|nr:hypothetical protein [Candidatus Minthenecus merdequi]
SVRYISDNNAYLQGNGFYPEHNIRNLNSLPLYNQPATDSKYVYQPLTTNSLRTVNRIINHLQPTRYGQ